jgi:hypothetical protein
LVQVGRIAEPHASTPRRVQRGFRAGGDRLALMFRHDGQDADSKAVGFRHVGGDEVHSGVSEGQ